MQLDQRITKRVWHENSATWKKHSVKRLKYGGKSMQIDNGPFADGPLYTGIM